MALFGGKDAKDEKLTKKDQELLEKYSLTDLDPKYLAHVKSINSALAGNKMISLGTALSGSGVDAAKLTYLQALVEQNWIIIRQLDELIKGR